MIRIAAVSLAMLSLALLFMTLPVHAQDVVVVADKPTTLEFSAVFVRELADAAVLLLVPLAIKVILQLARQHKLALSVEQEAALNKALLDGAQLMVARVVDPHKPIDIDFRSQLVAEVVKYAADHVRGVSSFDTPALRAKAEAQLATVLPPGALNGSTPAGGFGAAPADPMSVSVAPPKT